MLLLFLQVQKISFYPQNPYQKVQVRKVVESVILQVSDTCQGVYILHLWCLSSIQMWLDIIITTVICIHIFIQSASFPFLLKFGLSSTSKFTLLDLFCAGFSADEKHKLHCSA